MIFWRFWSSSIKSLFYKGWEVFWRYFWWFLAMLKRRKTLIFQGFVELGIELKMGSRRGWNRYAVPGNRTLVLKCKPCPVTGWKNTIIVQYYGVFLLSSDNTLHTFLSSLANCQVKILDMFHRYASGSASVISKWYQNDIKIISICNNTVTIIQYISNIILILCNIISIQT